MSKSIHNDHHNEFKNLDMEQKILRYSAQLEVPHVLSTEDALQQLKSKIALGEKSSDLGKSRHINLYQIMSVAASLIILFGIWYIFIRKPLTEVMVAKGEHTEYQLPDGSQVSLNAESKIFFTKEKFNTNRRLNLDGEAFFSVKKGKTFTVSTRYADIKVLGTSFNIFARDSVFKASCLTGKVSVTSKDQSFILTPGESAEFTNGNLTKFNDKNITTVASWRIGEFNFENAPLTSVFQEIERQFNVTFVYNKMDTKYFTGSFTNKNLVNALDIVCIPMGLTYEIGTNSNIFISEKTQ